VVATPIGNLRDLTLRARDALLAADGVLCEDTRRTRVLLKALGLPSARLERLDAFAEDSRIARAVERLREGESLALVTDAGTPAISDPGAALVAAAREASVTVTPVPGASSVTALLSVAGFGETAFVFRGFFPRQEADRVRELDRAAASEAARVFAWFESPERIEDALASLAARLPAAQVIVGKELTKVHERFFAGSAEQVLSLVMEELEVEGARGEWCFAIRLPPLEVVESSDWVKPLHLLIDAGLAASDAARRVSQAFGASKKTVYEAALKISGKKSSEGG
jgi:16S rRNA (cytidine1402-2'-O)-methyltransferase